MDRMRKVFIDLGGYIGDTVEMFYEKPATFGVTNPQEYNVYAFEPMVHAPEWLEKYPNVEYHDKAAWIEDCTKDLYNNGEPTDQSATLIIEDVPPNPMSIRVECIDFDRFLGGIEADEILLKMDIEGAEFEVLEKIIKSGKIKKITRLYVEFHNYRHSDGDYRYEKIKAKLQELGIPLDEWH